MTKLNFWQWLGIALLVFGVAWFVYDSGQDEAPTAPIESPVETPVEAPGD
ncbi:MAG: hypothetical protein ACFCVE_13350 [Phycisphaerae bacterium]